MTIVAKELLIDLYKIKDIYSGLGQFSYNFANELMNQSPVGFNITFLIPKNIKFEHSLKFNSIETGFQKRYFPVFTKSFDIWHCLQQFPSYHPNKKSKFILTVHDLNFLIEKDEIKKIKYIKRLQNNIDKADYITTISNYTKKTIEENINLKGKTIRTIYNGIEVNSISNGTKPNYLNDEKFFFSIGVFNEKKNFQVLLPLLKYFKDYKLIIAGNKDTGYGQHIQKQISELNLTDKIILPGTINENEKIWLYKNCEAFLFPSLAEGFGMPVIEAMRFGKPVFLSKYTSLPEIGREAAYYFENFDEEYISYFIKNKLLIYNENPKNISDQIIKHAEKFSWKTCVMQYIELYNEVRN